MRARGTCTWHSPRTVLRKAALQAWKLACLAKFALLNGDHKYRPAGAPASYMCTGVKAFESQRTAKRTLAATSAVRRHGALHVRIPGTAQLPCGEGMLFTLLCGWPEIDSSGACSELATGHDRVRRIVRERGATCTCAQRGMYGRIGTVQC